MKKCFLAGLLIVELGLISPRMSVAQIFTGTNAPGQGTNFAFTVGASATNLSVAILNNSSAYSYLLLKKGGIPPTRILTTRRALTGKTTPSTSNFRSWWPPTTGCEC